MHHVQSPRTDDAGIGLLIQAKGKTAARVTPADINQAIADELYFTAAQGIQGAYGIPAHSIDIADGAKLLTICVLVLKNGFTVTGESACASPENFDADIGRKVARENAVQKLWPLLGFQLKSRLAEAKLGEATAVPGVENISVTKQSLKAALDAWEQSGNVVASPADYLFDELAKA